MNLKISLLLLVFIVLSQEVFAQNTLDNHFTFKDGIYLSPEEYFSNTPSIEFKDGMAPIAKYGKLNESQFKDFSYLQGEKLVKLNIKDVWGISIKGTPYVFCGFSVAHETDISFLANTIKKTRNLLFNEIIYVGNISLFYHKQENWMIKANDHKPIRITTKNIKKLIRDDAELLMQFRAEKNKRKNKHAFLVKYNQSHPIVLNQLAHHE